uniref:NADH dehydrogenase subunit 6 n=1 Tax=Gadella imberbis TaxID=1266868 RepID=UPI0028FCDF80|nr:NADH dehydrogenase subunit 6 [Gadella imberbis]WNH37806.1 NADH dehydrogenase subunit 6 [Gadella imberbis]
MTYLLVVLAVMNLGVIFVASNPTPNFASLGLVFAAGLGCVVVLGFGGSFLALVLFLIYLGGMLVVFAYCVALAAEDYPEGLGAWSVSGVIAGYIALLVGGATFFMEEWHEFMWAPESKSSEFGLIIPDVGGAGVMYHQGAGMLLIGALVLLLTLFVVLEVCRGLSRGTLRSV